MVAHGSALILNRIEVYIMSTITFNKLMAESEKIQESGDCAVKAIALTTDSTYQDSHLACEMFGRVAGKGTYWDNMVSALDILGYKAFDHGIYGTAKDALTPKYVHVNSMYLNKVYYGRIMHEDNRKGLTPNNIESDSRFKHGKFIAFTKSHCLAVINGKVNDWTEGRQHRIRFIWEIKAE